MAHRKKIADPYIGIGCDQILYIDPPIRPDADFSYRIFNANGQEAEQCGNGARCAAKFVIDNGLATPGPLIADCLAGPISFDFENNDQVTVNMGKAPTVIELHRIEIMGQVYEVHALSLGNPHGVCIVPDIRYKKLREIGHILSKHPQFPLGANISFIQIMDRSHVKIRVIERGVGETLACGSGACAAMLVGFKLGLLNSHVFVSFHYGDLSIVYNPQENTIHKTGPAVSVFTGRFKV